MCTGHRLIPSCSSLSHRLTWLFFLRPALQKLFMCVHHGQDEAHTGGVIFAYAEQVFSIVSVGESVDSCSRCKRAYLCGNYKKQSNRLWVTLWKMKLLLITLIRAAMLSATSTQNSCTTKFFVGLTTHMMSLPVWIHRSDNHVTRPGK